MEGQAAMADDAAALELPLPECEVAEDENTSEASFVAMSLAEEERSSVTSPFALYDDNELLE